MTQSRVLSVICYHRQKPSISPNQNPPPFDGNAMDPCFVVPINAVGGMTVAVREHAVNNEEIKGQLTRGAGEDTIRVKENTKDRISSFELTSLGDDDVSSKPTLMYKLTNK